MKPNEQPRTLPRRAGKIRELATQLGKEYASQRIREAAGVQVKIDARQAVSDRIGYGLAVVIGAALVSLLGWWGVLGALALNAVGVVRSYRRWKALKR